MQRPTQLVRAVAAVCTLILAIALSVVRGAPSPSVHAASAPTLTVPASDPDRTCAGCHAAIYNSYEQTSMARGSGPAAEALHHGSYTSPVSGVTYRAQLRNGTATLNSRRDDPRAPLDDTETLEYFIGSGLHGRTYLFRRNLPQTGDALWYEAPVNWYTQRSAYGMAPAFDKAATAPLAMPTDTNCLHCHTTGAADTVDGTVNRFAGAPFRQAGIGCSACHGDTAAHVSSGGRASVLKLASLTPKRQDSVCLQCHLEGDALVQRAGRSLAHFKPGEDIDATAIYFVNAGSATTQARAASQYEGLLRSACRRSAGEKLTCVTCHDPHSSPAPADRVAYFRGKCLQCHADTTVFRAATHHPEQPDCGHCHMPSRATSDIAHTQNADHDIEVPGRKAAAKLTLTDAFHLPGAVDLVPVGSAPPSDRDLGLAYAQFALKGDRESHARALDLLAKAERQGAADAAVHQQFGYLLQLAGRRDAAKQQYEAVLRERPHDSTAETNLAVLMAQSGDAAEAMRLLRDVSATAPDRTSALLNLAMLQCKANDTAEAKRTLERARFFQPDSMEARTFQQTGDYAGMHCRMF